MRPRTGAHAQDGDAEGELLAQATHKVLDDNLCPAVAAMIYHVQYGWPKIVTFATSAWVSSPEPSNHSSAPGQCAAVWTLWRRCLTH